MDKLFKTFKRRLMLLGMAVIVAIIAVIQVTLGVAFSNVIEQQLQSNAKAIAVSISNSLMWDIDEYKLFLETRDVDSEYYKKVQAFFVNIKENSGVKYISTERRVNEKTVEYILDAEPVESEDYSPPGSMEPIDPQSEAVYSTGVPAGFSVSDYSRWGKLLGAYAPILDRDGGILGLVGINIDVTSIRSHMGRLQTTLLAIYAVILGLSWLTLSKYTHAILDPMLKDKLTGAYSKRYFEKFLQDEIGRHIKRRKELALLMLDLDHFKKVNDTYGHVFGDKTLASASEIIRKSLRPTDYFIRYGGEEFAVIATNANINQALEMAERIRMAVENTPVFNEEKNIPVNMTISIGVSGFNRLPINARGLIENADKALYAAKATRNVVSLFDPVS